MLHHIQPMIHPSRDSNALPLCIHVAQVILNVPQPYIFSMSEFVVYGARYSVYTRIVLLVLEESEAHYRLEHVDIFDPASLPIDYSERHPFQKIPSLEHNGFQVFETDAIAEYVVSATQTNLVPESAQARVRMRQVMRIADNYAYPTLVWGLYVGEIERGENLSTDQLTEVHRVLSTLDAMVSTGTFIADQFTFADCWLVPMIDYVLQTRQGTEAMGQYGKLTRWWDSVKTRSSVTATAFN